MRRSGLLLLLGLFLGGLARADAQEPPIKVMIRTHDGSQTFGTIAVDTIELAGEIGVVQIPLTRVKSIASVQNQAMMGANIHQTHRVRLLNGATLVGLVGPIGTAAAARAQPAGGPIALDRKLKVALDLGEVEVDWNSVHLLDLAPPDVLPPLNPNGAGMGGGMGGMGGGMGGFN